MCAVIRIKIMVSRETKKNQSAATAPAIVTEAPNDECVENVFPDSD